MKKVLVAFAVATTFAACGDNSTKSTETKGDTTVTTSTSSDTTKVNDSLKIKTDTTTTKMVADTTKK